MPTMHHKSIVLLIIIAFTLSIIQPVYAVGSLHIYYVGPEGNVKTALELAKFDLVADPAQADVFVLNGIIPNDETIFERIQKGDVGLVLILGSDMTEEQVTQLLGIPLQLHRRENPVSLTGLHLRDSLLTEIVWNGAPQVRDRFEVLTPLSSVQPLVTNYEDGE